ncbi:MAG: hypothetical protein N4A33_13000 [Bacteriovoracaceae bacterium]|jgi:hypothetical protein|nr:hypothetical protein [Bacteriovoracaceae bacterium]
MRITVVCPRFFGYENSITQEIANLGHEVQYIDDRPENTIAMKIVIRLRLNFLLQKKIQKYKKEIIQKILNYNTQMLLIITPEVFTAQMLKDIKQKEKKLSTRLYLWDSVKNKPNSLNLISLVDKAYSFDYQDSQMNKELNYKTLFYETEFKPSKQQKEYDLSFIGTFHSDRISIFYLLNNFKGRVFNHIYIQGRKVKIFRVLSLFPSFKNMIMLFKLGKTKALSKKQVSSVFQRSKAVIDYQHPNQSGFTCRTFEALACGCKLITTNKYIRNASFYDDKFIKVINRDSTEDLSVFINNKITQSEYNEFREKIDCFSIKKWVELLIS